MTVDADDRLRLVAEAATLTISAPPISLPSESNDTWKIGELVLRVCWRGDPSRLEREALILEHLPAEVPHVRLADAGVCEGLTWTLTHWVPGTVLSGVWAELDPSQRRGAAEGLGLALEALHSWKPSAEVRAALVPRWDQSDISGVVGADLNPLPVARAQRLVEPAMHFENLDPRSVERLGDELARLETIDPLTNPSEGVVVHGDAHLNNILWDGTGVAALLDFEWARLGPPDLDLQPLLAFDDAATVIRSVVDAYPGIAAHPRFVDRLWLYDLAATLRDLHVKLPLPATDDLPGGHPKRRLSVVLSGPGYLEALLDPA